MNINFQNKITIALIYIALIVINTFLGYLLFQSIYKKISFDKQKAVIYSTVIQRLKDIRKAQLAYKEVKSDYAGTFDELIAFIKSDSLRVVRKIGHLPDTLNEEIGIKSGFIITKLQPQQTPDDVIKMGKVLRDTVKIAFIS
ncbi:MAG: hypothetical protein HY738_12350 [Bacteroidia bacterium]|nr:hypothetical protein [Bacteroidia bacterium]